MAFCTMFTKKEIVLLNVLIFENYLQITVVKTFFFQTKEKN